MPDPNPYAAASAGALADIAGANPPAAPPAEPVPAANPPAEPVVAAPEPSDPVVPAEPAAPAAPAEPPAEELVELEWNGQVIEVPKSQVKQLAQMGFDYRQKTMTLADLRRSTEEEGQRFAREKAEIRAFLDDDVKVEKYLAALRKAKGLPTAPSNPDEIPTIGQLRAELDAKAKELHEQNLAEIKKSEEKTKEELAQAELTKTYVEETERTIGQLVAQHKILAEFYEAEDLSAALKKDAWKQVQAKQAVDPDFAPTPQDIKSFLTIAAQRRAAKAEAKVSDHTKMAAVRAAKLTTTGIEPPVGAPPTPPTPTKPFKLGSQELRNQVLADLAAASK